MKNKNLVLVWNNLCMKTLNHLVPVKTEFPTMGVSYNSVVFEKENKLDPLFLRYNYQINVLNKRIEKSVRPYLPEEDKKFWTNKNILLFGLLHELGHVFTFDKKVRDNDLNARNLILFISDPEEHYRSYRSLPSEQLADKWATEWARKNEKYITHLSRLLEE